jgi:hypothetical protein
MREIDGLRKQVGELMIHTTVSEAIVRTRLHQVGFNATEILWDELFKAREIDLFFVYARTWRTNNTANLQECARRTGTHIRVVLPDPSSEVILEELANRMLKMPDNFRQWIEEACAEFLRLQRVARKHGAEVSIWLASVTPIYSLYRFDDRAVLALNSYQVIAATCLIFSPTRMAPSTGSSSTNSASCCSRRIRPP